MASLEGVWRKLDRADEHLSHLRREMDERLNAQEYTVAEQADSQSGEHVKRLVDPPDLPPEWAPVIGDFTYNARATLDYLAWQLALLNEIGARRAARRGRNWPPKGTEFPIYADVSDPSKAKRLQAKLNRFSDQHREVIDRLQPHRRGNLADAEPLWLLDRFRNADAHRELHTVLIGVPASLPEALHTVKRDPKSGRVIVEVDESFEHRFEELQINPPLYILPGDSVQTTLKIKANFAPYVTFEQRGAMFDGQEVLPLLDTIRSEIERVIGLFGSDF